MARVYLVTGTLKLVYTVDQAVGNGCLNKRDDTLLVQFFLKVVSEGPAKSDFTPPGRGPIATDGIWGPTSQALTNENLLAAQQLCEAFDDDASPCTDVAPSKAA